MIPPPPTPRRPDHDDKPSIQLAMAASMLRRGRDPHTVAKATKVPLALVELINEHLDPTPTNPSRPQPSNPGPTPTTGPPDHHACTGVDPQACPDGLHHHRRCTRVILTALLGWVASTLLIVAAGIFHLPALGAAALILTLVLVTGLLRTVNPRPTPPDRD